MENINKFSNVYFTKQQISYLKQLFPTKEVSPTDTLAEIQYRAGVAKVVNFIESKVME